MGTDKRERQKSARQIKIEAERHAAKRAQTRRTALRVVVAVAVVLGGVFLYNAFWGDDDDADTATDAGTTTTTASVPEGPCLDTPLPDAAAYTNPDLATAVLARTAPDPAPPPADTPADALEITTLIEGEGEGVAMCDNLVVHYIGKTADGTVFDQSWARGEPFGLNPPLTIGTGGVIPGWDEGLIGAKVGERRRLVIGSDNAYGPTGNQGIPPNAPLSFEIDIVDIVKPPADDTTSTTEAGEGGGDGETTTTAGPSTTVATP